ncbi:PaaI family thioesterase [Xylophilus sp.]|uniref:PaaI family thioesterase n=1 Tax=Xylophilus sp. TaxID=2653893 RepID=UPI002D80CCE2|nr:PaaI family thioesterase [Xylophilus sp.]
MEAAFPPPVPSAPPHIPPPGFVEYVPTGGFMRTLGLVYTRQETDGSITAGLFIHERHLNTHQVAHGGLLATVADSILGFNAGKAATAPVVTVNLSVSYLGRVKEHDWLEVAVRIERTGRRLVFASCLGQVGGQPVVKAEGVFSVVAS